MLPSTVLDFYSKFSFTIRLKRQFYNKTGKRRNITDNYEKNINYMQSDQI